MAVHKFDSGYLFDHLVQGRYALSHMKGELSDSGSTLEEGFQVFLPEKSLAFYGASVMLLLGKDDDLVREAKTYKNFPYIQGGIEFKSEALKAVIVPDNFKKYLMEWLDTWSVDKKDEVFGDRDPNQLFITMAELHR